MKKTLITTILLLGLLINSYGQDSLKLAEPKALGIQLLTAFKSNNFELFQSLFLTESEYESMLVKMDLSDSLKNEFRRQGKEAVMHLHNQARTNFDNINNMAKSKNVNWKTTEFKEVMILSRMNKGDTITRADILVLAKSGDNNLLFDLKKCRKIENWHIMNKVAMNVYSDAELVEVNGLIEKIIQRQK